MVNQNVIFSGRDKLLWSYNYLIMPQKWIMEGKRNIAGEVYVRWFIGIIQDSEAELWVCRKGEPTDERLGCGFTTLMVTFG